MEYWYPWNGLFNLLCYTENLVCMKSCCDWNRYSICWIRMMPLFMSWANAFRNNQLMSHLNGNWISDLSCLLWLVIYSSYKTIQTISWILFSLILVFGSFGLSTKEPYTIMFFVRRALSCIILRHPALAVSSSVHTSPIHRFKHRNFILGTHMYLCPSHVHIKHLVILICSF